MNQKKSIQELTIKDNFMFGAVMLNPENCKGTLERALGIEIARVEVSKEKSIVYNPEYKGVRLEGRNIVIHRRKTARKCRTYAWKTERIRFSLVPKGRMQMKYHRS